ncbi:MAG TPA: NADH-quinone oxidoreductase subunit J [Spirochaetia bacterium]|nr:NADH-quinone oxidoreductase subunit J [Spirochaetia bacterium]
MTIAFVIAGTLSIIATLLAVSRSNTVHALLYLIGSLLALAVAFYTLGAAYAAVLEIMVYAGAIVVLLLFVVMIMNLGGRRKEEERALLGPSVWVGPSAVVLGVAVELAVVFASGLTPATESSYVSAQMVNAVVFGPYVIGVELASFLLLAGVVSAVHLGRRHQKVIETGSDSPPERSSEDRDPPGTGDRGESGPAWATRLHSKEVVE